ncbi:hypothetical protein QMO14_16935 [Variovorax sp. CAN2819]|uniref:hypothetical protein n=1 Tax=Variovorax sp. CAN15 TaxID=3046727 RepID=UPI002648C43B|nr:hypothetical protein [Variovorax sp. CAN15]MDN6885293.1 hypothetical protein [Variovorax sp. CAN15]
MNFSPATTAALATLFAAGLAATVSLVVSVLAKEQKTSEFRQQWIDALRNDVAEWLAEVAIVYATFDNLTSSGRKPTLTETEQRYENFLRLRMLRLRIDLRLNPAEHAEMIQAMNKVRDSMKASSAARIVAADAVLAATQKVLKAEWRLVKRGERAFVLTKIIAGVMVSAAIVVAAVVAIRSL